ncbi:sodium/sugar symporter [Marinifilum fragile]|jgi:SSS sodium solute transporter superfamily|uniref:sodium/sugar symporter n=1 Tax=Marinifilum fragile TaxID=570161 RepID=UPI002AA5E8F4|nr:sodium/sugar symporter [Marinifilum fragile]
MNENFALLDYMVFGLYACVIIGVGLYVSRTKKGEEKTAEDYFLAGKTLPWWAIGASLIAANISAEQFIGMSGSGFKVGLAIASYEWMAAITLIVVAKYFLPIFIKQGLYTIPEFVEKRFNTSLKTILAVFWIGLFVLVNLTSVLYLGGKALDTILGLGDGSSIVPFMIGLALFAAAYSVWGGLSAVAWTDVIQVILLVIGGLVTTVIALNQVTPEGGALAGMSHIYDVASDKFHMILKKDNPEFLNLPGIAVLIGGMWVANLYYWGFNQYIIQRALAAKSLKEAQRGIAFAAFLKVIVPLIVVVPGIIAFVMYQENIAGAGSVFSDALTGNNDHAYPWLISNFVPIGLKGLVVAALSAAIVSSLASMLNSTATIFTMDIYKPYINKSAGDRQLVSVGRISVLIALFVATAIANTMGSIPQMFQYIQEYTGVVSPGILAVFLMGLFWKKTNVQGAIIGVLASIPVAFGLKFLPIEMPFLDQMFYTLIITMAVIVGVSLNTGKGDDNEKAIPLFPETFATGKRFNISAYILLIILVALYAIFW